MEAHPRGLRHSPGLHVEVVEHLHVVADEADRQRRTELAGDLVAARKGRMGLVASDLLDGLGEVWVRWGR